MDGGNETGVLRFPGVTFDPRRGRLEKDGLEVHLRAKSFAVLSYLIQRSGEVVSRDDLLAAVWPNVVVTEDSLVQCVSEIRRALGPAASDVLRTVHRRGYLLQPHPSSTPAGARRLDASASIGSGDAPAASQEVKEARRRGLAVVPFRRSTGAVDRTFLDGVTNDVIARLARLRSFPVIARGSVFALRRIADDPKRIGGALGVAYVVAGVAEARGGKTRLHVELASAEDGEIVWTNTFDFTPSELGELMDAVVDRIASSVEFAVTAAERRRALVAPDAGLDAWTAYHRGLDHVFRFDPAETRRALAHFEFAIERDPAFARAFAAKSFCHYFLKFLGADGDSETRAAIDAAVRAMELDPSSPAAQWAYGRAAWLSKDPDASRRHLIGAVDASPSFAHAHYMLGFVETHHGDADRALDSLTRAEALSPYDPFLASVQITRAIALVRRGALDEAADWAARAAGQANAYSHLRCPAALILAESGRLDEARRVVAAIRRTDPDYSADRLYDALFVLAPEVDALFRRQAPRVGL